MSDWGMSRKPALKRQRSPPSSEGDEPVGKARRKSTKAEEPVPSAEAGAPAEAGPTTPAAAAPPAPAPAESPAAAEGKAAADDAAPAAPIDATVAVKKLEKPTLQSEEWGMAVLSGAVAQLRDGGWGAAADKVQRILDEGLEGAKP